MMPAYVASHKIVLDSLLLGIPDVVAGKMFGFPAYYIHKKLFACIYGDGVGVKVPEEVAKRLLAEPHIINFQPLGKSKMREWVQINHENSDDYRNDFEIFMMSVNFVGQIGELVVQRRNTYKRRGQTEKE